MSVLATVETWSPETVAIAVVGPDGVLEQHGPVDAVLPWASVTKLVSAYTTLLQVQRGALHLDEPAGPEGATLRHLLAHASGLPGLGSTKPQGVGSRRIYSNEGYQALADVVAERCDEPFADLVSFEVLEPLGLSATTFDVDSWGGGPDAGLVGPLEDMIALAREFLAPTLLESELFSEAISPQFPDLSGVVPGWGRQDPCPWGLGFEIKGAKAPHWTAPSGSPRTFGHYGGAGSFLWVDPDAGIAAVELASETFGAWALEVWPTTNDEILATYG